MIAGCPKTSTTMHAPPSLTAINRRLGNITSHFLFIFLLPRNIVAARCADSWLLKQVPLVSIPNYPVATCKTFYKKVISVLLHDAIQRSRNSRESSFLLNCSSRFMQSAADIWGTLHWQHFCPRGIRSITSEFVPAGLLALRIVICSGSSLQWMIRGIRMPDFYGWCCHLGACPAIFRGYRESERCRAVKDLSNVVRLAQPPTIPWRE